MIAITGAAGVTGRALIAALNARGAKTRAVVTREASALACKAAGAGEAVLATFADREALAHAFAGAETVFHIPPRMKPDEVANGRNVIDAAVAAGVRTIALHSVITSQVTTIRFHNHKREVEELAMHCGLPWRIFQPTNYMQNVTWNWERMIGDGEFVFPYSADSLVSWLDLDDYAEGVARALTEPGWDYGVYEMASAKAPLTRHQLAGIWSRVTGLAVRAVAMPLDQYMALPH